MAANSAALAASSAFPRVPDVEAFDTRAIQQLDAAHYLHPFTDHAALRDKGVRVIVRAQGVYLWDSEGRQVIDGMSGLWCVNAGYGRTSISEAVYRQMETLPFYNSFFNTTNVPAVRLAAQALGFASGLASGGALGSPEMRALLGLAPHERAVCFVGVGTPSKTKTPRERPQPGAFFSSL